MARKTDLTAPQRERARAHADAAERDDLIALRAVERVASTASFSAAARALGVQVSTVTRAVQRVEQRLGARLFRRSTHGVSPTEAGRAYAEHAARWLAAEDELRDAIGAARGAGRGALRVTLPVFVAEHVLPDVTERFLAAAPEAALDVHASDDFRDLVKDGFDLAIRLGPLTDSTLRCRRVVCFSRVVCASPELLAKIGAPRTPATLANAPCLIYGGGAGPVTWTLRRASGEAARIVVQGRVRSNNLALLTELALRGHGVTRLPEWAVRDALRDRRLVRVLPAWQHERDADRGALYAVHPDDPGKERLRSTFLQALEAVVAAWPRRGSRSVRGPLAPVHGPA